MAESILHKKRDARILTRGLTPEEAVEQHKLRLAAEAAANQTLDGSLPTRYSPDPDPNRLLEFGREIESSTSEQQGLAVDSAKANTLRKTLLRKNLRKN